MAYFAKMTTVNEKKPRLVKFPTKYDRDGAIGQCHYVGIELEPIYASELTGKEKREAYEIDSWYQFERKFDFGYEVKYCETCGRMTYHKDGKCMICAEYNYKLYIWVAPRNWNKKVFLTEDEFKSKKSYNARKPEMLNTTDPKVIVDHFFKASRNELESSLHLITDWDTMEHDGVKDYLIENQKKLASCNIEEVRWWFREYSSTYKSWELRFFLTPVPPNWNV